MKEGKEYILEREGAVETRENRRGLGENLGHRMLDIDVKIGFVRAESNTKSLRMGFSEP